MKKPIIGLVAKSSDFYDGINVWYSQTIGSKLRYAVLKNNGVPIGVLPTARSLDFLHSDDGKAPLNLTNQEKKDLISQIDLCDGIILQGGEFSDPFEEWIAQYCFKIDKPLLGICAGYNNIIRGLGGKTRPDKKKEMHNRPDLKYAHEITVDKKSKFYQIVKKDKFQTNSLHEHIADVLNNLDAVAWSDDGFIEVVENKNKKFFLGVKFHPELLFLEDKIHNKIIKTFVETCAKNIINGAKK